MNLLAPAWDETPLNTTPTQEDDKKAETELGLYASPPYYRAELVFQSPVERGLFAWPRGSNGVINRTQVQFLWLASSFLGL